MISTSPPQTAHTRVVRKDTPQYYLKQRSDLHMAEGSVALVVSPWWTTNEMSKVSIDADYNDQTNTSFKNICRLLN